MDRIHSESPRSLWNLTANSCFICHREAVNLERALDVLLRCPMFQGVASSDILGLAQRSRFRTLGKGETLFLEGDPSESLFIVSDGWLKVYTLSPGGERELTLHLEGAFQPVGTLATMLAEPTYQSNCAALEETIVFEISSIEVRRAVTGSSVLSASVIQFLARRQVSLTRRLEQLFFTELGSRLGVYLLEHASNDGFALPTNSELASLIGTVPELVSRKLGEFYRLGGIRLEKRRVWIVDARALRDLVER
jgi:CRP/FNR family transcriptional regulator, dissimilatory nitrate respiration regulator